MDAIGTTYLFSGKRHRFVSRAGTAIKPLLAFDPNIEMQASWIISNQLPRKTVEAVEMNFDRSEMVPV